MKTPSQLIKAKSFQVVQFTDTQKRDIILLYALGEDGIVYEFSGGWLPLPIRRDQLKEPPYVRRTDSRTDTTETDTTGGSPDPTGSGSGPATADPAVSRPTAPAPAHPFPGDHLPNRLQRAD
jgi:hypothetical protein